MDRSRNNFCLFKLQPIINANTQGSYSIEVIPTAIPDHYQTSPDEHEGQLWFDEKATIQSKEVCSATRRSFFLLYTSSTNIEYRALI
jgi:hypothetical protein